MMQNAIRDIENATINSLTVIADEPLICMIFENLLVAHPQAADAACY